MSRARWIAEQPPGEMIYFLHEWMTVAEVEDFCRDIYRAFDRLPSIVRQAINAGDAFIESSTAAKLVREFGAQAAADMIMEEHRIKRSLWKRQN